MKNAFGTLKGIPVYKVEKFDLKIAKQGCIQLVDDGDQIWKICTTSAEADGIYDSARGNINIYDEIDFNANLKVLEDMLKSESIVAECLLPELDTIIDNLISKIKI